MTTNGQRLLIALALGAATLVGPAVLPDERNPDCSGAIAERLVARCDAVLRMGGPSQGADLMVKVATDLDRTVFRKLNEVPGCASASEPRG